MSLDTDQIGSKKQSFVIIENTPVKSNRVMGDDDDDVRMGGKSDHKNYAMAPL